MRSHRYIYAYSKTYLAVIYTVFATCIVQTLLIQSCTEHRVQNLEAFPLPVLELRSHVLFNQALIPG